MTIVYMLLSNFLVKLHISEAFSVFKIQYPHLKIELIQISWHLITICLLQNGKTPAEIFENPELLPIEVVQDKLRAALERKPRLTKKKKGEIEEEQEAEESGISIGLDKQKFLA